MLKKIRFQLLSAVIPVVAFLAHGRAASCEDLVYVSQGEAWTSVARADFYTRDQGSHLIPYLWFQAITHADGTPFLDDQLDRYGYCSATISSPL